MKLIVSALALTLLSALPADAADPQTMLAGPRQAVHEADYRASGHLVRVDPSGKRISDDISIRAHWFAGVLRILVEVTGPANAREHVLLEMHPGGQSSILIAHPGDKALIPLPSDKWSEGPLGTGFSYEDFLQTEYFWPSQSALPSEKRGARDCDVLMSTPGLSERTQYTQVRTWLDHTIDFPIYQEKTLTSFGLRHDGGIWSASQVEEKNNGQPGSTLLIINRGSSKAKLSAADFSPESVLHF
jgi:Outer membrane lipoprotein-sorting protein